MTQQELITQDQQTDLLALDQAMAETAEQLDAVATRCQDLANEEASQTIKALKTAAGINRLRSLLTDKVLADMLALVGTPLGIEADGKYDAPVVRDALIEAAIRGFRPVNQEFGIIQGRFYGKANGYYRLLLEHPEVSQLVLRPGVPHIKDNKAVVSYYASWMQGGSKHTIVCQAPSKDGDMDSRIPVVVNKGMGPDAVLGKAKRKMLKRIYEQVVGFAEAAEEVD